MAGVVVPVPSDLRFGPPERLVLACIQVATDINLDTECPALLSHVPGVNVRMAKMAFDSEYITAETYEDAMAKGRLKVAADSMRLPDGYVTTWGLACTSFSFLISKDRLLSQLPAGARLVTMWDGVCAALRACCAKRIAVLTPYLTRVHERNVAMLEERGFEVARLPDGRRSMHLNLAHDRQTSNLDPDYLKQCIRALAVGPPVDALFLGCSALRVCVRDLLPALEAELGVTVVTSTQAFLWHALRGAGVEDKIEGYGKLLCEH